MPEIIEKGAQGFSGGNTQNEEGNSQGEADPPCKNREDVRHFCQGQDPSSKEDSGEQPVEKEKGFSQGETPVKHQEAVPEDGSQQGEVFVQHDVRGGAGDSGVAGDNGKADEKANNASGNDGAG